MWVIRVSPGVRLLDLLADGRVVVDARGGRMALRLELSPKALPPETDAASRDFRAT